MTTPYFAHSANRADIWHPLAEHLSSVASLSYKFSANMHWAEEARLAGLMHDLGKYGERFQARLHGTDQGLDHWSQGAWIALKEHGAIAAALAIQGHHVGLQQADTDSLRRINPQNLIQNHPFRLELSEANIELLKQRAELDGLAFRRPEQTVLPKEKGMERAVAAMLDVRMLFSCLVDADFLDTEAHFEGDAQGKQPRLEGPKLEARVAILALDEHMAKLRNTTNAEVAVRQTREALWCAAVCAGQKPPGLFTLTAPTGSGKTLAMLKFALEHAARNNLKRIVLAVPFLSIIEQTARQYRKVFKSFPDNFILEHHSLTGLGVEAERLDAEGACERQRRLLAENWDAPIVLTTNVQLLESLFSNRPSSCRKLHNLMESVILFDEAQSLPTGLAVPTLAALSHLSAAYRSTIAFATATQPAFDTLHETVEKHAKPGWQPDEAVPEHAEMFNLLRRTEVSWPQNGQKMDFTELAAKLRSVEQVLCVVNLKRHALALLDKLNGTDGLFHLSTNMCAEHRREVLKKVCIRLSAGETCLLVSTQCIEAGVDLDFPLVYRALAPLEAIAQAAGRCNREGRMEGVGAVVVFEPEEEGNWRSRYPTHAYFQATEVTRKLLAQNGSLDINDPSLFREYYRQLYDLNNPASQNRPLSEAITAGDFSEVARLYRIIDKNTIQVLVPWADCQEKFATLRNEAMQKGISAQWMRHAQGLAVNIYMNKDGPPAWAIPAKLRRGGVSDAWFILEGNYYDNTFGLNPPKGEQVFIA